MAEEKIVLPYEQDAIAGREMPDGLSQPDQKLYLELRMLYQQYKEGIISREQATREKKRLLDEYQRCKFREELGNGWTRAIKNTELARAAYRKERTLENADKLLAAIEGR